MDGMSPGEPIIGEHEVLLVSACLTDVHCRYDARSSGRESLMALARGGRVVALCPEVAGGLGVPREPADIVGGTGEDVLDGRARVVTHGGRDVTADFLRGARAVLEVALGQGVTTAVLKSRSPSCGVGQIYGPDRVLKAGDGVTAALLRRHGIRVISDEEWSSTSR